MNWSGVMPAMTTPFDTNMKVDHGFLAQHAAWQLGNGCHGLVMLGSLGEGATLEHDEKLAILKTAVRVAGKRPVVAAISSLSTRNAVQLAKEAEDAGCSGLMVLPPYVYTSDWYEMKQHVSTVIGATKLECMLYNNPVAYKTDFLPNEIAELAAEHANLAAVKESSADVRRVMAIREVLAERLRIFVGVDDVLVEAVRLAGSRASSTRILPSRFGFSNSRRRVSAMKYSSSIAGSCRCCGWTPCQNSCSSSSGCRKKQESARLVFALLAWSCTASN